MNGYNIPEAIQNAPVLSPGMHFYYTAYVDLMSCRGGWGDGDIPWTAVQDYANRKGMSNADFQRLWDLVKRVDLEYLKFREKKSKEKSGN